MANATKATPTGAPWKWDGHKFKLRGAGGRLVLSDFPLAGDDAQTEANAHLIAAAPDLMSALLDALACYDPGTRSVNPVVFENIARPAMINAIRKANGELS